MKVVRYDGDFYIREQLLYLWTNVQSHLYYLKLPKILKNAISQEMNAMPWALL